MANGVIYVASFRPAGEFPRDSWSGRIQENAEFDQPIQLQLEAEDTLTAIDAETGKTIWTFAELGGLCWTLGKRGGLQIAPAVDTASGKAWFVGTMGNIYCVDITNGTEVWRSDIGWAHQHMKRAKDYYFNGATMQLDKREARKYKGMPKIENGIYVESLTPTWHGGVRLIDGVVVVNDGGSGLVSLQSRDRCQTVDRGGINSFMAAPAMWANEGKEYILTAGPKA